MNKVDDIVVCPVCRGRLSKGADGYQCTACARLYPVENGIPGLIIGERFEDDYDAEKWLNEEKTGRFLVENYILPLLDRLFPGRSRATLRILSVGCGVGQDVEVLNQAGFECYGMDSGSRTEMWSRRLHPERYFLANAKNLPFMDGVFDFVFLNCVLPHIGVLGDTCDLKPGYEEERLQAVHEVVRVTRPQAYIMPANPNRSCPVDLFHRPCGERHWPRLHSSSEKFLLSFDDHVRYFQREAGCRSITTLPLANYWGFFLSSKYLVGRVLKVMMKAYFKTLSTPALAWLRRSGLNPWLVVLIQK